MTENQSFKDLSLDEQYNFVLKDFLSKKRKFINFTKNYHLNDELNDKSFNIRFNKSIELQELFDSKHDHTKEFFSSLNKRVKNKDHIILVFFGSTNSGKSWAGISISESIQKMFKKELDYKSQRFLSFSDVEYKKKLPQMKDRDIMIRDETPNLTGEGSRTIQKNLGNVMAITRAGQFCYLFISPDQSVDKSNVVSFYLESAGINKEKGKTRLILYDKNMVPLGRIFINKPTDQTFLKDYEKKKHENIKKIMQNAGSVGYSPDMIRFQEQIHVFAEYCRNKNISRKGEISSQVNFFNLQHPELSIGNIGGEKQDIINNVYLELLNIVKKEKKQNPVKKVSKIYDETKDFIFDKIKLYDIIKENVKWRNVGRDFKIYEQYMNSEINQYELAEKYPDLGSAQAVNAVLKKVTGSVYLYRGKMFEEQFHEYLKKKYVNDPDLIITYDGGNNKPDIYLINKNVSELVVLSLKCFDFPLKDSKYPLYIKWQGSKKQDGFIPEIEFAGKHINGYKTVNVFAVICNARTGKVKSFPFNIQHKKAIKIEDAY